MVGARLVCAVGRREGGTLIYLGEGQDAVTAPTKDKHKSTHKGGKQPFACEKAVVS